MKLYVFMVAPNPTRVRLYLAEKAHAGAALPVEQVTVDLAKGEQKSPEHLARSPFGKLPVLELDDGSFLTESGAIIEYLEERFPEPPLLGIDAEQRGHVRELDRIADISLLMPIARAVHATNSPLGMPPQPEVAKSALEAVASGLAVLDDRLADGRPFLAGDTLSVGDCTLAAGLQFGRFGKLALDLGEHIARWDAAYRQRPAAGGVLIF